MKSVAIIGSGIAGLTAAYLLKDKYRISVFEKNDYIGGHTATIDVPEGQGTRAVDTGFIVFNDRTYPLFEKLLDKIGVGRKKTEMSFSVTNPRTGFEYNGHDLNTLFAQRRNLLNPKFWRLLYDIVRFNALCKRLYRSDEFAPGMTLAGFMAEQGFNRFFQESYILPMGAAIWSTSLEKTGQFDMRFFVRFFYHHGLLNITDRPQWYVIPGGSREYIAPLTEGFSEDIRLNSEIRSVSREDGKVQVRFEDGTVSEFDYLVFACHSDQALALLSHPSETEKVVLGGIPYTPNRVVLHRDTALLPKRKRAWASWNYHLGSDNTRPATVTYLMNRLQGFECDTAYCVTLNCTEEVAEDKIIAEFSYHHPVLDASSTAMQQRRSEINGLENTFYCGAYWYNGFHEDGVRSAVDVAALLGVDFD